MPTPTPEPDTHWELPSYIIMSTTLNIHENSKRQNKFYKSMRDKNGAPGSILCHCTGKNCSDGDCDGTVSERPMWPITCGCAGEEESDLWPDSNSGEVRQQVQLIGQRDFRTDAGPWSYCLH